MLVAGVVHDEVDDDAHAALVGGVEERLEVLGRSQARLNAGVIRDVVPAVAQGRGEEGREPQTIDAEPLEVVELVDQAPEVSGAVAVAVFERPDQDFVEHRRLEPLGLGASRCVRERFLRQDRDGNGVGRRFRGGHLFLPWFGIAAGGVARSVVCLTCHRSLRDAIPLRSGGSVP